MSKKPKKIETPMAGFEAAMVPAGRIRMSDDNDPRRGNRPKALQKIFKGSIRRKGVQTAVLVYRVEGDPAADFEIIAGRRRLTAAHELIAEGVWAPDAVIPATIVPLESVADLKLAALTENVQREAMHDVDIYETVAGILAEGGDERDAAAALGLNLREIRQAQALGAIAEPIREDWRADKVDDDVAKAFTVCSDLEKQVEVYDRLRKAGQLYVYAVRQALGATTDVSAALACVGQASYTDAGGEIREDLFDDSIVLVSDRKLLDDMLADKIAKLTSELTAEGWSWVLRADAMKDRHRYKSVIGQIIVTDDEKETIDKIEARIGEIDAKTNGGRLTEDEAAEALALDRQREFIEASAEKRMLTPEVMAKSGCIIQISEQGLRVSYAMALPDAPGAAPAGQPASGGEGEGTATPAPTKPSISAALMTSLTATSTRALAEALAEDPEMAISVLAAGLGAMGPNPVKIISRGLGVADLPRGSFVDLIGQNPPEMEILGRVVGAMLDLRRFNADSKREAGEQYLIELVGVDRYEQKALALFDPGEYFASASLARLEEAVAEMNADRKGKGRDPLVIPAGKKAEKAAWAAARAREASWLPPELVGTPF